MSMIPKEVAKKIRYIQIFSNKIVTEMLAGEYHSVFKGRGMEFDEVREYEPGDEIRSIDWNVTARMGYPYVKRYVEEREQTLFFLVDLSASGTLGSVEKTKNEVAAEICALLAFSAIKNNDKVGLIIFTDHIEHFVPPGKGSSHVLHIIRDILMFSPSRSGTDIGLALDYLGRVTKKTSVVFLISDFQASGYETEMKIVGRRHDLIAVTVADKREFKLPDMGMVRLKDAETGEVRIVDTGSASVRRSFEKSADERRAKLRELLFGMQIDQIEIVTDSNYVRELVIFFKKRERRLTGEIVR